MRQHEPWLMQQPEVNAIGIALAGPAESDGCCLEISTGPLPADARRRIEEKLGDVPVRFVSAGPFQALKR